MIARHVMFLVALTLAVTGLARAADLAGQWTSDFDSQIGPQKYAYEFKVLGDRLTGKAKYNHSMGQGESVLTEIKVTGDDVGFVEKLNIEGMEIIVTYHGKFVGDEVKLTRTVGDFAVEEIVLKRAKEPATATP